MKKIFSRIKKDTLLHLIVKLEDIENKRLDTCPNSEFLQVSCFALDNGKTFDAHRHVENYRSTTITQESWVVIKGKVKAVHYDLDDSIISETILEAGDCSVTFYGGHNYECLEDGSIVYEFKTGPYFGKERDKVLIS